MCGAIYESFPKLAISLVCEPFHSQCSHNYPMLASVDHEEVVDVCNYIKVAVQLGAVFPPQEDS